MSITTKSPRKVILAALAVGKDSLPEYAHRCSPKTYTQPQLFACLALKTFLGRCYRGVEAFIRDFPAIREWIGLKEVPDHSTLQKFAMRIFGSQLSQKMLDASVRLCLPRTKRVKVAAMDSTGLESRHCSAYFVRRRARGQKQAKNPLYQTTTYTRFPKLGIACDVKTHVVVAAVVGSGPSPDHPHFHELLDQLGKRIGVDTFVADAGYDSEENHEYAREEHGVRSIIPPLIGRQTSKPPSGRYRRQMARRWKRYEKVYGQRWQSETVFSMIKRNLYTELTARSGRTRNHEMILMVLTHNIMILLLFAGVFDRAS